MTYTDSLKTKVKEVMSSDILELMDQDVTDPLSNQVVYSQEDIKFLSLLEKGVKFQDGHIEQHTSYWKTWGVYVKTDPVILG